MEPLPQRIPPFRIEGLLGVGATARVFRAVHEERGEVVAVKLLHAHAAGNATVASFFRREIELLGRLDHPGIVGFRGAGIHEGLPWMAMELLTGHALDHRLAEGPLPWREAVRIFRDLAEALSYLHGKGFTHRDLKPANIVIDAADRVRLVDLGIAAAIAPDVEVSLSGAGAGTPRYMSPEQVLGQPATPATDLYSTGICLFEAVSGQSPFPETTEAALLAAHVQRRPRALDELAQVPAALVSMVAVCLAKEAGNRYEQAADLREDLAALLVDPDLATAATLAGRKLGLRREGRLHGRTREMKAIGRWLARQRAGNGPSLLLVRGDAGAGKSAVAAWAKGEARRLGWALSGTATRDGVPELRIVDEPGSEPGVAPGVALLATAAGGAEPPPGVTAAMVDLAPLGPGALARWAREEVGLDRLDRRDRDFLLKATAGVPGRVEPLLFRWRELRRRGEAPPPGALQNLLEASAEERRAIAVRLESLGEERRLVLELAAFLDPCATPLASLAGATGAELPGDAELLAEYLRAGLGMALDGDRLVFRDRVLPEVVRSGTSAEMKNDLIAAALELLAPEDAGVALRRRAELLAATSDEGAAEALAWRAARRFHEERRELEAAATLGDWIGRSPRPLGQDEIDLVGECARIFRQAGSASAVSALLDRASQRAPAEVAARIDSERAGDLFTAGRHAEARPIYLANALRARSAGDTSLRFRSLIMLATIAQRTGRSARALRVYAALVAIAGSVAPYLQVEWLRRRGGLALLYRNDFALAATCQDRAWALTQEHGLGEQATVLRHEIAQRRLLVGEREKAWELLAGGLEQARAEGNADTLAWLLSVVGVYHLQGGDAAAGARALRSSNHWAHRAGLQALLTDNHELLARIAAHHGQVAEARRLIRLARRHNKDAGDANVEAQLRIGEADLALLEGDAEGARERLASADELAAARDADSQCVRDSVGLLLAAQRGEDGVSERWSRLRPRLERSWSAFRLAELELRLRRR